MSDYPGIKAGSREEDFISDCFSYDKSGDFYYVSRRERISFAWSTSDIFKAYHLNRYSDIFPEYNPETDDVIWSNVGNMVGFILTRRTVSSSSHRLPPGFYSISYSDNYGYVLDPVRKIERDNPVDMGGFQGTILSDMDVFFSSSSVYRQVKMTHKRACLLFGPHGNGKTFGVLQSAEMSIRKFGAIVLIVPDGAETLECVSFFQKALESYNKLIIVEEITDRINRRPESWLTFLDGESSWNDVYIIATTNYPGELPLNVVDRPGRFDLLVEVVNPSREERFAYLTSVLGESISDDILNITEGFSIAYLKLLILESKVSGEDLSDVVKRICKVKTRVKNHFKTSSNIGFKA